MKLFGIASFVALAITSVACHPTVHLQAPDGFAEMKGDSAYDFRAASARGVVLAVRAEKNEPRANLDFWTDAIDLRLRAQGYTAEVRKEMKSADGHDGRQLRYTRIDDHRTYR